MRALVALKHSFALCFVPICVPLCFTVFHPSQRPGLVKPGALHLTPLVGRLDGARPAAAICWTLWFSSDLPGGGHRHHARGRTVSVTTGSLRNPEGERQRHRSRFTSYSPAFVCVNRITCPMPIGLGCAAPLSPCVPPAPCSPCLPIPPSPRSSLSPAFPLGDTLYNLLCVKAFTRYHVIRPASIHNQARPALWPSSAAGEVSGL